MHATVFFGRPPLKEPSEAVCPDRCRAGPTKSRCRGSGRGRRDRCRRGRHRHCRCLLIAALTRASTSPKLRMWRQVPPFTSPKPPMSLGLLPGAEEPTLDPGLPMPPCPTLWPSHRPRLDSMPRPEHGGKPWI